MNLAMRDRLGLSALLLAVLGLHLWQVQHLAMGLHIDEAQYRAWADHLQGGYFSKPPMIALLIAGSVALFGDSVLGLKALAMACWPLSAAVVFALGNEMGGRRVAWRAALLFLSTPALGLLGLVATTDAPLLLAWSLASWALWRTARAGGSHWAWLGLAVGLGLLSKYTMAAFSLSVLAVLGLRWMGRMEHPRGQVLPWAHITLAVLIAALLIAPNIAWNAANGWVTWRHTAELTVSAPPVSSRLSSALEFLGGQLIVLGPGLALWLLWRLKTTEASAQSQALRFCAAISLPLLAIGTAVSLKAVAQINWAAPMIVGACLAAALLSAQDARWPRGLLLAVLVDVLLTQAVIHLPDAYRALGREMPIRIDAFARMRGWQTAFDTLAAQAPGGGPRPGDTVIGTSRGAIAHGTWAWRSKALHWTALPEGSLPSHHWEVGAPSLAQLREAAAREPGQSLWYLADYPPEPALLARMGLDAPLAGTRLRLGEGREIQLYLWRLVPQKVTP